MDNLDQMVHYYKKDKLNEKDKLIEMLISFYENIKKEVVKYTGDNKDG